MDVNSLNTAYVDAYRMNAPVGGIARNAGGADFSAMLKKAAGGGESGEAASGSEAARGSVNRKVTVDKTDKLYEQCLELETFLVKTLVSSMRNTVQKSGLIDEGFAGKMYEDMLYDEYAKDLTRNANFGLAEQAYLELTGQRGKVIIRS